MLDAHSSVVTDKSQNQDLSVATDESANKQFVEFVIQKFDSPMGVATYTTAADMPEELRKALPDMDELKRIMAKEEN